MIKKPILDYAWLTAFINTLNAAFDVAWQDVHHKFDSNNQAINSNLPDIKAPDQNM